MKRPHSELIKLWADGAQIEYLQEASNTWIDCPGNHPCWLPTLKYRVKLQPWQQELVNAVKRGQQVEYNCGYGWEPADMLVSYLLCGKSLDNYHWYERDCYRVKPQPRFAYAYEVGGDTYLAAKRMTEVDATQYFNKLGIKNYQQLLDQ